VIRRRTAGLALGAAIAVALVVWPMRPTDEARIRRSFADLIRTLEKTAQESPVASVQRADRAANLFAPDCRVDVGWPGVSAVASRAELRQAVVRGRAMLSSLRIVVRDETVAVSPDRSTAAHRFTARALAERRGATESAVKELELGWVRTSDGWRIGSVRPVDAIRPLR